MRFNELLTGIREDIAVKLYGDDLDVLADKAEEISRLVSGIRGVAGVKAEATRGLPQITVHYDRNELGRYGLNIKDLNDVVQTAFSGGIAGVIYEGERMFDLVVRLDERHRKSISDIRNLYVNTPGGSQIPLSEVADISYRPGPMQISRDNTNRRTYVGINVEGRDVKSLVEEIRQVLNEKLDLPPGYYIRYGGAFENLERATKRLTLVVPLALILIFLLVFFAVKSFPQTLMICIAIPFAAIGGIYSLYLREMHFSISAGVGFIVLFGVAVLNGLILVNGFNALKREGTLSLDEIIKRGSVRRLRPILLTATVDILGFLPMAVSTSAGAEVQRPLATVVIGGMITSTFLTLVVLPVLYRMMNHHRRRSASRISTSALSPLIIVAGLACSGKASAQETGITLQQALERAGDHYPSLKAASLEIDRQTALKKSAYDLGITSVYTGSEETGNGMPGVRNQIGVAQEGIDLFGIAAKNRLGETRQKQAATKMEVTRRALVRDVSIAWYRAWIARRQWQMNLQLDSVYARFAMAAELRYRTSQTSKVEFLAAKAKYQELSLRIRESESMYRASLAVLNQYLMYPPDARLNVCDNCGDDSIRLNIFPVQDSIVSGPLPELYRSGPDIARAEWKAGRTGYFPKLDLGYALQSVDGLGGFYSWQAGFSVPLLFFSQSAKTKAARIEADIADQQYRQRMLELNASYREMINRYNTLVHILTYYRDEALPLAMEQMNAANLGYRLGNIDYIQFIQNMESAMKTRDDYLKRLADYYQVKEELKYISEINE